MKKYYAVRKGRVPGIYSTWDECKAQVAGFKGAEYKKFGTEKDAKEFIAGGSTQEQIFDAKDLSDGDMAAYVDGSYNVKTKEYGYGIFLFTKEGEDSAYGKGNVEEYKIHRNVAGEVLGALKVMEMAMEMGKKTIFLHYDYAGIEYWAKGEWKRNTSLTKAYKEKYDLYKKSLEIHFIKVKAHSGDIYNEKADQLAKKSVGIK